MRIRRQGTRSDDGIATEDRAQRSQLGFEPEAHAIGREQAIAMRQVGRPAQQGARLDAFTSCRRCPDTRSRCTGSDDGFVTGDRTQGSRAGIAGGVETKGPRKMPRPGRRTRRVGKLTQHGAQRDASTERRRIIRWPGRRALDRTLGLHEAVRARGNRGVSGAGPRPRNLASRVAVCSKSMA